MDNGESINTNQADTPGVPTTELDVRRQETVVVMRTADGRPATKTITQTDDGAWAKENAKLGIEYRVWRVMFDGLDGLYEVLEVLLKQMDAFIVRGGLSRTVDHDEIVTKRHKENYPDDPQAVLVEEEKCLVPVDFDDVPKKGTNLKNKQKEIKVNAAFNIQSMVFMVL